MIDPKKQYRARDGREVRIYAVDGSDEYPIHGAYKLDNQKWYAREWDADGAYLSRDDHHPLDLIEVKPRIKRTVWLNVYDQCVSSYVHETREEAEEGADRDRIACVKVEIDVEEGHGL
jgi:hypothetical protein